MNIQKIYLKENKKIDFDYPDAIGGVDLSSTTDLTCATILIVKQGIKYVLQQYFLPIENIEHKIKEDKIPYDVWEQKGLLTLSEGANCSGKKEIKK